MYSYQLLVYNADDYTPDDIDFCAMHRFTMIYSSATNIPQNILKWVFATSAFGMSLLPLVWIYFCYLLTLIADFKTCKGFLFSAIISFAVIVFFRYQNEL